MSYVRLIGELAGTIKQQDRDLQRYIVEINCAMENIDNHHREAVRLYGRNTADPVTDGINNNPVANDVSNADANTETEGSE